ncbi:DUF4158 domain-containing protein [Clostridium estertheticum]|uniref:DUF4158 domain-containing protein n=1 Tax=Clostridium estertheticum TaxID=238834 RepID=UPI001CF108FD|nr:DUF4158 domain-containing protein [Clostridium estertheticum]
MGFAIQLGTVRFLGAFSSKPANVPDNVSVYVLSNYCNSRTIRSHTQKIREIYGYHDFMNQPPHFRLVRSLFNNIAQGAIQLIKEL